MTQPTTLREIITNILDQHAAYKTWEEVADAIVKELHLKEDSDFSVADMHSLAKAGLGYARSEIPASLKDFKAGYVAAAVDWNVEDLRKLNAGLVAEIAELKRQQAVLVEALERLARLGNGDRYGNSEGNMIAIAALDAVKPAGQEGGAS